MIKNQFILAWQLSCLLALAPTAAVFAQAEESYPELPDSKQQDGVAAGELSKGQFSGSKVFPGTIRDYWLYVPKQVKQGAEVGVMVFQDGGKYAKRDGAGFRVPNVFDNLIAKGEMPVTVALFIQPGIVPAAGDAAQPRFNRSFEYDSVDDRYSKFLIDEMFPFIEAEHGVKISKDPNRNAICGSSSGGIAAFVAAWHRPDVFRRVFTTVGTYVSLRGGDTLAGLVRKTEPKPLRIFLQDGKNDLNIYGGDWWVANQQMLRALEWAGYEVDHAFADGGHNGKHGAAIFPDVMRWLWKEKEVKTHPENSNHEASRFLVEGEDWELVGEGFGWAEGLASTAYGDLYFTDVPRSKLYRIKPGGEPEVVVEDTGKANGISLGADGKLYGACGGANQIRAWDLKTMEMEVIADGTSCNDIVVRHDGTIYYTDPKESKIWMIDGETRERKVVDRFKECNGIGLSADQTQLFVAHFPGRFIYSFTINEDGTLGNKQPYYHMEIPVNGNAGQLDGMCVTTDGWLVATSALGVQICDQPGRSHLIIPMPVGSRRPSYVAFGGEDGTTLYVGNVDKLYRRKTKMTGAPSWKGPIKPPKPRL
ncbi:MAG: SMP-30/gluconolactonase/LRE family protein [Verrucomicrobiales bacterium]